MQEHELNISRLLITLKVQSAIFQNCPSVFPSKSHAHKMFALGKRGSLECSVDRKHFVTGFHTEPLRETSRGTHEPQKPSKYLSRWISRMLVMLVLRKIIFLHAGSDDSAADDPVTVKRNETHKGGRAFKYNSNMSFYQILRTPTTGRTISLSSVTAV